MTADLVPVDVLVDRPAEGVGRVAQVREAVPSEPDPVSLRVAAAERVDLDASGVAEARPVVDVDGEAGAVEVRVQRSKPRSSTTAKKLSAW